jgi:hypothetical protein
MKKSFPLLIIFLLMLIDTSDVYAQGNRYNYKKLESKFGYGIKAGVNMAYQSSSAQSADINVKNILGINAGGYCNYFPLKLLGVQAELMLSGKGAHWSDFYDDMKDIITYLDIPLLIKYQPARFINVHMGVQAGFRLSARQKDLKTGIRADIKDYYNFSEYCLTGGVEANLPNKINLTLRYVYGLTSATNEVQYIEPWTNKLVQFSVGYRFSGR